MPNPLIVAGVDVGGSTKGFHAVALRDGCYWDRFVSRSAAEIAQWCQALEASVIGIDAPCNWSADGRARPAERELMEQGIWCFSTPTKERAKNHPTNHYGWMLNGRELFDQLSESHPLFDGTVARRLPPLCFETFPHAIACKLERRTLSARNKRRDRSHLLQQAGIVIEPLVNIDLIDAALCALMAHYFALGHFSTHGEPKTGLIVVPSQAVLPLRADNNALDPH